MNSIRTRVMGVLVGCGLMAATPFLSGAWGQGLQPDDGVWCTKHLGMVCWVCKNCVNAGFGWYTCGTTVAQQTCPPGYTAVCQIGGPFPHYETRCDLHTGN